MKKWQIQYYLLKWRRWQIKYYLLIWVPIRRITIACNTYEEARDYAERDIKMLEDNYRITEVEN